MISIYKESVELTSVYLIEGCGKTLIAINDTIPHTRIDMGYGYTERDLPQVSIRSECCSVSSSYYENYHIFDKGLAKKHFHKYVMSGGQPRDLTNVRKSFYKRATLTGVLCISQ